MMGDESLGKREVGLRSFKPASRSRPLQFVLQARSAVRLVIAQHGVADTCQLVGERAGGLVVIGAGLDCSAHCRSGSRGAAFCRDVGGTEHRACAVGEQHAQVAIAALGDAAEVTSLPEECSFGVRPNQEAKWRASRKWLTSPHVAATIAVAVSKPTPGTDSNVVHAGDWRASAPSCVSSRDAHLQ